LAVKIKHILDQVGTNTLLFSSWLSSQGINVREQHSYAQTGWLDKVAYGVFKVAGADVSLLSAISAYNNQLGKKCLIGAETALELRGYSHYVPMGKPLTFLFTDKSQKMPIWFLQYDWDRSVRYQTTSFLGADGLGIEKMVIDGNELLISSPERAMLECLNRPSATDSLMDVFYLMEMQTTLRPNLLQQLLERCTSVKVKRLFLYMAEKAGYPWYRALDIERIDLGTGRRMVVPTGKYVRKYNMTIPTELYNYA